MTRAVGARKGFRSRSVAYAALVLTAGLWASSVVGARGLLDSVPPVTLTYLRWLVVLIALAPFAWPERKAMVRALREYPAEYTTLAAIGFAPQTSIVYFGLLGSTATMLGLLNSAIPVIIIAMMTLLRGRATHRIEGAGVVLSSLGVIFILAHGDWRALLELRFRPSDLLLIAGMVVWAYYTIRLTERHGHLSMAAFLFLCALLGLVLALPLLVYELATRGLPTLGTRDMLGIAYLGTLPTVVAMLLFGHGLARVGAVQAGIFTHLVPVFVAILAALFLDETLHAYHAVGFVLIAGGAILCCLRPDPVLSSRPAARAPTVR